MKEELNNIEMLVGLSKDYDLPFYDLHKLYSLKVSQYLIRDYNKGNSVDWMLPVEQYRRANVVLPAYVKKTFEKVD